MTGLIEAKLRRAIAERPAAKVATFAKPSTLTADGSGYGGRGTVPVPCRITGLLPGHGMLRGGLARALVGDLVVCPEWTRWWSVTRQSRRPGGPSPACVALVTLPVGVSRQNGG